MPDEEIQPDEQAPEAPVPASDPAPEDPPAPRLEYAVQYRGMPDPETAEGRVWHRGGYQWLPEVIARRVVARDDRFVLLAFPAPREQQQTTPFSTIRAP